MKNNYDHAHSVYTPQGRLLQVDYACEPTSQGGVVVCVRNSEYVVMAAVARRKSKLAYPSQKIYSLNKNVLISFVGISTDVGPVLDFVEGVFHDEQIHTGKGVDAEILMDEIHYIYHDALRSQRKRPFGVTTVLACIDKLAQPRIFIIDPRCEVAEVFAVAAGRYSQASRTTLEQHKDELASASLERLTEIAIMALKSAEPEITDEEVHVACQSIRGDIEFPKRNIGL